MVVTQARRVWKGWSAASRDRAGCSALLFAVLSVVAACRPAEAPANTSESAPHAAPAQPAQPSPASPALRDAGFHPCGGRARCTVEATLESGVPGIFVVRAKITRASDADSCDTIEHWRVERDTGRMLRGKLLTSTCNDGYGAAGVGDDTFTVAKGVFEHVQYGGSAWRHSMTHRAALAPLRYIGAAERITWMVNGLVDEVSLDFRTLAGHARHEEPECTKRMPSPRFVAEALPIPLLDALPAAVRGPLADVGLGTCALRMNASGKLGYLLRGAPGEPSDAALAVLAIDENTLLVEIEDDLRVTDSTSWLYDDHLEIWVSADTGGEGECRARRSTARQWGIRVADGRVFPAHGSPEPLAVEVVRLDDRRARMRIALPPHTRVSVVYSDSDDGQTQERLLSTSKLIFGDGGTLSPIQRVKARAAVCSVAEGKLVLEPGAAPQGAEAFLPPED